jgi:hypothetical protein
MVQNNIAFDVLPLVNDFVMKYYLVALSLISSVTNALVSLEFSFICLVRWVCYCARFANATYFGTEEKALKKD